MVFLWLYAISNEQGLAGCLREKPLTVIVHPKVRTITVTPANIDELESLWELMRGIEGLLIADKGLIGHAYHQALKEQTGVNLQTPSRCNMQDNQGKDANRWLTSTR